ncbi:MAG TPA: discoidin domain-containing protein [Acidobacteriaceae bacterium]|jgi:hypothetical protein|nr:discoidin domain-containing protein [Acidobacteriaceae bacterium]
MACIRSFCLSLTLVSVVALSAASAQTLRVDTAPADATNHFVPSKTFGGGVDRIQAVAADTILSNKATLAQVATSGWQPITYRQNTELAVQAWHWNPVGTWSDPSGKGYFTGSSTPTKFIRHSYGYSLPMRGFTRNDGTGNSGYSRLTDGDTSTYWKSNPYLSQRYTGEPDSMHPQWVTLDLSVVQPVDSIRINWAAPYATNYVVQYWNGIDPVHLPTRGIWQTFPHGIVTNGAGGIATIRLTDASMSVRYIRVLMTSSSNTCDTHGSADPRNCVGYAINELYLGTTSADGVFHDMVRHTADQEQSATLCSSVDSWHEPSDLLSTVETQIGFDFFFTSGVTKGLPAVIPIAMIYDTPDNAAAELKYIEARKYPVSYVEMGEEVDGQYMSPEDYAALYLQFATALHRVDPNLKLGGPSFEGVNEDIKTWPDAEGRTSWLQRFLAYLQAHGRIQDLAFFSFEHYPYDPCHIPWSSLYEEPELVSHIMKVWDNDGLPTNIPRLITESNLSSSASETYMDIFSGLWLADYIGSFVNAGGNGVYFFHYLPLQMEHGCNDSEGTFGMFTVNKDYQIQQPLAQYFASRMINFEWVQHNGGMHRSAPSTSTYNDGAGHEMVTAYPVLRPDGEWSVMMVNRDQWNAHKVRLVFSNGAGGKVSGEAGTYLAGDVHVAVFGSAQYKWHPAQKVEMSHLPNSQNKVSLQDTGGNAEPDGPIVESTVQAGQDTEYEIPAASIEVVRGKLAAQ